MSKDPKSVAEQDKNLRGDSTTWANWMSVLGLTTCQYCKEQHGKIVAIAILGGKNEVQAHRYCLCIYVPMRTKKAGSATNRGMNGTDVYLIYYKKLPEYYIKKGQAQKSGWMPEEGNLADACPGKMIGGGNFKNHDLVLPTAPGRIWYEADINYVSGFRNKHRILYSNDGLIFVTYDHYETFYEITY